MVPLSISKIGAFSLKRVRLVAKKQNSRVKRTLYASPLFFRENKDAIAVARHLIAANLIRLKKGEIIEKNGFIIKKDLTGETRPGKYNEVTLRVTYANRVCFVKIGVHSGEMHAKGYERARKFLNSINHKFNRYKVYLVPAHVFYEKTTKNKSRGIAVSDFFPKESGALLHDIRLNMGTEKFNHSELGTVFGDLNSAMFNKEILDAGTYNCFYSKKEKAFYFFDLI